MATYVVTGSNGRLGSAFVAHFAADPKNTVIGLQRNDPTPDKQVKGVKYVHCEVTDADSVQTATEEVRKLTDGKVDVLVNNAGLSTNSWIPLTDHKLADLEKDLMNSFRPNVVAQLFVTTALVPLLRNGSLKRIYNISSPLGATALIKQGVTGNFGHATSRAGTNVLTLLLGNELGKEGFTVVGMMPSAVWDQEFTDSEAGQALAERSKAMTPNWRAYLPPDGIALMLSSLEKMGVEDSGRTVGMWVVKRGSWGEGIGRQLFLRSDRGNRCIREG